MSHPRARPDGRRILDGQLLCSASDLVGFAACGHLTYVEVVAEQARTPV